MISWSSLIFALLTVVIMSQGIFVDSSVSLLNGTNSTNRDKRNGVLGLYLNPNDPLSRLAAVWWAKFFDRPFPTRSPHHPTTGEHDITTTMKSTTETTVTSTFEEPISEMVASISTESPEEVTQDETLTSLPNTDEPVETNEPVNPEQNIPSSPGQNIPISPGQNIPSSPGQNLNPNLNPGQIPNRPIEPPPNFPNNQGPGYPPGLYPPNPPGYPVGNPYFPRPPNNPNGPGGPGFIPQQNFRPPTIQQQPQFPGQGQPNFQNQIPAGPAGVHQQFYNLNTSSMTIPEIRNPVDRNQINNPQLNVHNGYGYDEKITNGLTETGDRPIIVFQQNGSLIDFQSALNNQTLPLVIREASKSKLQVFPLHSLLFVFPIHGHHNVSLSRGSFSHIQRGRGRNRVTSSFPSM